MLESAAQRSTAAATPTIQTSSTSAETLRRLRAGSEYVVIPLLAVAVAALAFAVFLLAVGKSPVEFVQLVWKGGFGTSFSIQNTLQRASPLILSALCVAIPARIGLIIIGGEGALVVGGFAAAVAALPLTGVLPPLVVLPIMFVAAAVAGAAWIAIAGWLRYARGVNETISSLLLTYIGIAVMNFFVEGALRDMSNPNKPSTRPLGHEYMVGKIPGTDVHWGLAVGVLLAIGLQVLMSRTTFGFAARIVGGNARAALAQGLPVGRIVVACAMIAGACAGIAGFFEVAAIQGSANASLVAGYGFTGILVAFLARQNPLAIVPVAVMFGGIVAAGGIIQRRMGLPDATVLVLQGFIFIVLLISETLYGRFAIFRSEGPKERT